MRKLAIILTLSALSYGANGSSPPQQNSSTLPQTGAQIPSDCSQLSDQEQQFASQLSPMHRAMFCRYFSDSQRIEAMTLVSSEVEKLTGKPTNISPDEAVEIVMKTARQNQNNGSGQQIEAQPQQNPYSKYGSPPNQNANTPTPMTN